jgi:hypothetical protein
MRCSPSWREIIAKQSVQLLARAVADMSPRRTSD